MAGQPSHNTEERSVNMKRNGFQSFFGFRLALLGAGFAAAAHANCATLAIPLENKTGLDPSRYTIYVLGYSTGRTTPTIVPPKVLTAGGMGKTGRFVNTPPNSIGGSGSEIPLYINSFKLGEEITSIVIDYAADSVAGARIFFFVADSSLQYASNGLPPRFPYTADGASVVQCANPPQSDYPIYNYVELTYILGETANAVIDVSAVDGFNFPISITLNDNLGRPLGQPLGYSSADFNREAVFAGYDQFMAGLAGEGGAHYLPLKYSRNGGGLLNPTFYVDPHAGEGTNSALNHVFDAGLNAFFSAANAGKLSITTDGAGSVAVDTYTAAYSAAESYCGSALTHPALKFTGINHGRTFTVFNPVGFSVVDYLGSDSKYHNIQGQMSDTTLTFSQSLPGDTPIVPNMHVSGPGANDDTLVVAVNKDGTGRIASLTLNNGSGTAAPGAFLFSKARDFTGSPGAMVFGCYGVFADKQGKSGDEATVLLALQRDIVSAFNRGVANKSPAAGEAGRTSAYWGMETNWYPAGEAQNLFSLYMHTATVRAGGQDVTLFTLPDNAVSCARGAKMSMSYGFAYDENPVHVPAGQPQVPAKHDPLPDGVSTTRVTLGAWNAIEQPLTDLTILADGTGSTFPAAGEYAGQYHQNTTYRFVAHAGTSYAFSHWTVDGGTVGNKTQAAADFVFSRAKATVTAHFNHVMRRTVNDYDGDGASDPAVFDTQAGTWYARGAGGAAILWAAAWGWPGAIPVPGDYDADFIGDMAVFDDKTGNWFIRTAAGATLAWSVPWGWPGAIPVGGDYDADGRSDLAVFDDNTGSWYVQSLAGGVLAWSVPWGWPGAIPVGGDYDDDGRSDFAVFDGNTGSWYVQSLAGGVIAWAVPWGWPGAIPVGGDYDADGRSDLAVFDNNTGFWYIKTVAGATLAWAMPWGWPSATPVPGDFDGDGVYDLAVFDNATGNWYVKSLDGITIAWAMPWGWPGAIPPGYAHK